VIQRQLQLFHMLAQLGIFFRQLPNLITLGICPLLVRLGPLPFGSNQEVTFPLDLLDNTPLLILQLMSEPAPLFLGDLSLARHEGLSVCKEGIPSRQLLTQLLQLQGHGSLVLLILPRMSTGLFLPLVLKRGRSVLLTLQVGSSLLRVLSVQRDHRLLGPLPSA